MSILNTSRVRLAVVSCASLRHGYFDAYCRIAERADLDLALHLGEYIHEYGNLRDYEPSHEIPNLADCRTRHAQYRRDADLQELRRQRPMITIWDDHECVNDAWSGGAQNHTEGAEGARNVRVSAALQGYYAWMPVRVADPSNLRRNNRSFALGNLAELIMLEKRVHASSQQGMPGGDINLSNLTQGTTFSENDVFSTRRRKCWAREKRPGWPEGCAPRPPSGN